MKDVEKLEPRAFTKFCMSIGAVPSSYLAGLTIEEQLLWLCSYLEKEVIPAVNNNGEAVSELQALYIELHDYVEHYFDNLDVQEEINNKLDAMAESGELENIIASYLQTKAMFCFENIEDLKSAEYLTDGCYASTMGYYSANDGGSAIYKVRTVTNDDVEDDAFIIPLDDNTLVGELIITDNTIYGKQIGLKNDESENQTNLFNIMINKAINNKYNINLPAGTICISGQITIPETQIGLTINGFGGYATKIKALTNSTQILFTNFLRWKLNNIYFVGTGEESEPLLYIQGVAHLSEINNCNFASNKALKIDDSAYLNLNHCSFNNITDHITNYLLNVTGEYFYARNCYFEGQSNSSAGSKAVIVGAGQNYYFEYCDFCNWNNGDALTIDTSTNSIKEIYISHSTFVRNDVSIHSYCDKGINNVVLNENVFIFLTGNENKIFYNERRAGTTGMLSHIRGHNFIDGSTIDLTKQMLTSSGWLSQCTLEFESNLGFPDYDDYFTLKFFANFPTRLTISAGAESSKTLTILSRSPYKDYNLPTFTPIKYNGLAWTDYTISNTYQGALTITFNFGGTGAYTQAYLKVDDI